jgi:hypothetical protein
MSPAGNFFSCLGLACAALGSSGTYAGVSIVPDSSTITVAGDEASFTGIVTAPVNSAVIVNGTRGVVNGGRFYVDHVPVSGTSDVVLRLNTLEGESASAVVHVAAGPGPTPVVLTARPSVGGAPLYAIDYYVKNRTGSSIVTMEFAKSGAGPFKPLATVSGKFTASYPDDYRAPGVYQPVVRLTDDQGRIQLGSTTVVVEDPLAVDLMLRDVWAGMNAALSAGDTVKAQKYLSGEALARYASVFQDLGTQLPSIVQAVSPITKVELANDYAEYSAVRRVNNVNKVFLIYFVRDGDGIWRVDSM